MAIVKLRKVGGSIIVAIPPAFLEELRVGADSECDLAIIDGTLVMKPARKRYRLDDLLAQCDLDAPLSEAEREWMEAPAVGLEVLPDSPSPGPDANR